jgi:hypothetical protein
VIGPLFAIPRTPSVPKSFCDTGYVREAGPGDQLLNGSWICRAVVSSIVLVLLLVIGFGSGFKVKGSLTAGRWSVPPVAGQTRSDRAKPRRSSSPGTKPLSPRSRTSVLHASFREKVVSSLQGVVSGSGNVLLALLSDWSLSRIRSSESRFSNWPGLNSRSILPR